MRSTPALFFVFVRLSFSRDLAAKTDWLPMIQNARLILFLPCLALMAHWSYAFDEPLGRVWAAVGVLAKNQPPPSF